MKCLTAQEILVIHARIIDKTAGLHGVRDVALLQSLVERPKTAIGGKDMFSGVFQKAAGYVESLARHHVFTDGNKRTAIACAARFLYSNGYMFKACHKEVEEFVLKAVEEKLDIAAIALWLKRHSEKL